MILAFAFSCGDCTEGGSDQPPTVVVSGAPANGTFLVGDQLYIQIQASDPEGGTLKFSYDYKPKDVTWTIADRAEFLTFANEAVFTWDPLASDALNGVPVQLVFIVEDSAGSVTEKVVTLNIVPGNGRPVFKSSASELYDPRSGQPIEFTVTVTDQDSAQVELLVDPASKPAGSTFDQIGPYEGRFRWQPTPEQLERRVYSVGFTADDKEHDVQRFTVTIVMRTAGAVVIDKDQASQQCPGEAVISHEPLRATHDAVSPYRFEARLLNPAYDRAVLYIASSTPYNGEPPPDGSRAGDAVEMVDDGTGLLVAEVSPYTSFIGSTGELSLYYQICAFDDDATGANAIACAPSSGDLELWHTFTIYRPDSPDCVDDSVDRTSGNDDFDRATPIDERWGEFRVCPGNDDFYSVSLRDGESALFSAVFNQGADIAFEAYDSARSPISLNKSSCTGLVTGQVDAPPGGGTFYFKASGNNANYVMRTFKTGNAAECSDHALEPNNTAATATPVTAGQTISGEICPDGSDLDVYGIALQAGETVKVTHRFSNAAGNLDMTLFAPGQEITTGGTGTGAFTYGLTDVETLEHTATGTGTYNLLVFNNNDGANAYTLEFEVSAAPACTDNDAAGTSRSNAMIIAADELVEIENYTVCPGAADWFQRTEFAATPVLGEVRVMGGDGSISDVTVTAYDNANNIVGAGVRTGNVIEFDVAPQATGQIYYKVESTKRVQYTMTLLR